MQMALRTSLVVILASSVVLFFLIRREIRKANEEYEKRELAKLADYLDTAEVYREAHNSRVKLEHELNNELIKQGRKTAYGGIAKATGGSERPKGNLEMPQGKS